MRGCSMFARGRLFTHPAPILAYSVNSSKSNYSRTYDRFSCNSNHSRTCATPRGGGSPSSTSDHPQITTYRPAKFFPCVSYAKTGGYPFWSYHSPRTSISGPLLPLPPIFPVHRAFTILLPGLHPWFSLSCHNEPQSGV